MSDKIKIKHVKGGIDGDKLKGCYFVPAGDGTFDFHEKNDESKLDGRVHTGIKKGSVFQFHLPDDENLWQIDVKEINDKKAHGKWFVGLQKIKSPADEEGSGTFQAQAGGATVVEDCASSATA